MNITRIAATTTQIVFAAIRRSWLRHRVHLLESLAGAVVGGVADGRRPDQAVAATRCRCARRRRSSPRPRPRARRRRRRSGSAFGRKRDSNTRPRYSCVIPRSRPWPTASTTVTPTWPVCSSTASITVSTRSRRTTASTLVTVTHLASVQAPAGPNVAPDAVQRVADHAPGVPSRAGSRTRSQSSSRRARLRSPGRRPVWSVQMPAALRAARIAAASSALPTPWPCASSRDVDADLGDARVAAARRRPA